MVKWYLTRGPRPCYRERRNPQKVLSKLYIHVQKWSGTLPYADSLKMNPSPKWKDPNIKLLEEDAGENSMTLQLAMISWWCHKIHRKRLQKVWRNSSTQQKTIWTKHEQRTWTGIYSKKIYKGTMSIGKDAGHHWSSEKCGPQPWWAITSHLLRRLL